MAREQTFSDAENEILRALLQAVVKERRWGQKGTAAALDVSQQTVSKFLTGEAGAGVPLAQAIASLCARGLLDILNPVQMPGTPPSIGYRIALSATGARPTPVEMEPGALRPSPTFVPDAVDPVELALFEVMREKPYAPRVFDAARQAVRDSARWMAPGSDARDIARGMLEAAASLDRDGHSLTSTAILARLVTGKSPHAIAAHAETKIATNAEVDARLAERGVTAEDIARNKEKLKATLAKRRRAPGAD